MQEIETYFGCVVYLHDCQHSYSMAINHSKECVDYSCWSNQQKKKKKQQHQPHAFSSPVCSEQNRNSISNMHKNKTKRFSLSIALYFHWGQRMVAHYFYLLLESKQKEKTKTKKWSAQTIRHTDIKLIKFIFCFADWKINNNLMKKMYSCVANSSNLVI